MFVRQLIGRQAGTIVEMPFHAATAALACGTCSEVSDAEIAAAGIVTAPRVSAVTAEEAPRGYRIEADPVAGYNVRDPGGVQMNAQPFPNLSAARSFAHNHHQHAAGQSVRGSVPGAGAIRAALDAGPASRSDSGDKPNEDSPGGDGAEGQAGGDGAQNAAAGGSDTEGDPAEKSVAPEEKPAKTSGKRGK